MNTQFTRKVASYTTAACGALMAADYAQAAVTPFSVSGFGTLSLSPINIGQSFTQDIPNPWGGSTVAQFTGQRNSSVSGTTGGSTTGTSRFLGHYSTGNPTVLLYSAPYTARWTSMHWNPGADIHSFNANMAVGSLMLATSAGRPLNLGFGANLTAQNFNNGSNYLLQTSGRSDVMNMWNYGNFVGDGTGYLGFVLQNGSNNYYGWMRVRMQTSGSAPENLSLLPDGNSWVGAINNVAGQDLQVGSYTAVPEPATSGIGLAVLALGAAGIRGIRRSRKEAAAKQA